MNEVGNGAVLVALALGDPDPTGVEVDVVEADGDPWGAPKTPGSQEPLLKITRSSYPCQSTLATTWRSNRHFLPVHLAAQRPWQIAGVESLGSNAAWDGLTHRVPLWYSELVSRRG